MKLLTVVHIIKNITELTAPNYDTNNLEQQDVNNLVAIQNLLQNVL